MDWNDVINYEADVVIVGSEGAGSTAAIEAAKNGLSVIMITKGNGLGRSGATITGEADLAVDSKSLYERFKIQGSDPGDNKDIFFEDMLKSGKYLNQQDIVKVHVEDAPERLNDLLNWGLKPLFVAKMSGHSYPRGVMVSAPEMIRIYRKKVKESGAKVLANIMVQELVYHDGQCSGVFGIDMKTGKFIVVQAKTTLLATGGGMRLYPITTGPEELTGDGTAMALRAGVELSDMEFPMFLPGCFPWPPMVKGVNTPFKLSSAGMVHGHLLNKHGERFMSKWDPVKMERSTRDILSVGIWTEIAENRGGPHGGVFVSLKHLPDNLIDYIYQWLPPKYLKKYGGFEMENFIPDLRKDAVESVPACHFFNGGIKIDTRCHTNLEGLYAAGEVVAGIHGANRLSGNAFTDMIVWGHRAALSIVEDIKDGMKNKKPQKEQIQNYIHDSLVAFERSSGEKLQSIREETMKTAWDYAGIVREKALLEKGKEILKQLKQEYKNISLQCQERVYNKEWIRYLETKNMLDNLECIILAATYREESRGSHYRKDFPQTDYKNWLINQVLTMKNEQIKIKKVPCKITTCEPSRKIEKYGI